MMRCLSESVRPPVTGAYIEYTVMGGQSSFHAGTGDSHPDTSETMTANRHDMFQTCPGGDIEVAAVDVFWIASVLFHVHLPPHNAGGVQQKSPIKVKLQYKTIEVFVQEIFTSIFGKCDLFQQGGRLSQTAVSAGRRATRVAIGGGRKECHSSLPGATSQVNMPRHRTVHAAPWHQVLFRRFMPVFAVIPACVRSASGLLAGFCRTDYCRHDMKRNIVPDVMALQARCTMSMWLHIRPLYVGAVRLKPGQAACGAAFPQKPVNQHVHSHF